MVAALFGGGLALSDDDGASWDACNTGLEDFRFFDVVAHPYGDLFAGSWDNSIYRSQDGGATWFHADDGLNVSRVGCLAVKYNGDLFAGGYYYGASAVDRPG